MGIVNGLDQIYLTKWYHLVIRLQSSLWAHNLINGFVKQLCEQFSR